ncbi:uncharacterized protein METZ01_LOCUS368937, partial [marine metagenome]
MQVPFLDIRTTGTTVSPVEVLFEKFIDPAAIDSMQAITAGYGVSEFFEARPPVTDFM